MRLRTSYFILACVAGIVVAGCSRDNTAPDVPMVLQITPTSSGVLAGKPGALDGNPRPG